VKKLSWAIPRLDVQFSTIDLFIGHFSFINISYVYEGGKKFVLQAGAIAEW
jgi:hypothetical protein